MTRFILRYALLTSFVVIAATDVFQQAAGQTPAAPQVEELRAEDLQARMDQLEQLGEEEAETKKQALELYQQALKDLDQYKELKGKIAEYQSQVENAAANISAAKRELEAINEQGPEMSSPENTKSSGLQQQLNKQEATLAELEKEAARLDAEPKRRADRLAEIPKLLAANKEALAEVERQLAAQPPATEHAALTLAKQTAQSAKRQRLALEIETLESERHFYEATEPLLQSQTTLTGAKKKIAQQEVIALQKAVSEKQQQEAEKQVEATQQEATSAAALANPLIAGIAQTNAELAEERQQLLSKLDEVNKQLTVSRETLSSLTSEFGNTRKRLDAPPSLSQADGELLRHKRTQLPDVRRYRRNINLREPILNQTRFTRYEYEEQAQPLAVVDFEVKRILNQVSQDQEQLEPIIREFLTTQSELLTDITTDYRNYTNRLLELSSVEQQIIDVVDEFGAYIDERVLWIRSTFALSLNDLQPAWDAKLWLSSLSNWKTLGWTLVADMRRSPFVWTVSFLLSFLLFRYQRKWRRNVNEIGEDAARRGFSRFSPTMRVLVLTVLISIPWPLFLWFLSWRLSVVFVSTADVSDFVRSIATGLSIAAAAYLPLELLRHACRTDGLFEAHFGWPDAVLRTARRNLRWFMLAGLPLLFVTTTMQSQTVEPLYNSSLGRVAFILLMAAWSLFSQRTVHPNGTFSEVFTYRQDSYLYRLRYLWYSLAIAAPLALAILSGVGYYYTARKLAVRLFATLCLLWGTLFVGGLLYRWLLISRRKIAMEQAKKRRAEAVAAAATTEQGGVPNPVPTEEPGLDLVTINEQTKQLIKAFIWLVSIVGLWVVWDDVFPAISYLQDRPVFDPDGLKWTDLILAMVSAAVTVVALKNLPGFLELTVLQKLPLDAGARYAWSTLTRYAIMIAGIGITCRFVDITWSKVQWLVAAVSVGLGFGLQEIFANFVSGLIILFERPIRVGDIITISNTTGIVSRVRIRATTITDWDRKEYVVPNKDIVTGQLLNWTLSDQINRIVVNVGVAYGSDTEKARSLLLQIAQEHPVILDDPAPIATFEGFGDSTLNFVLRCYLPSMENRLPTIHDLHTAIDQAFRRESIEIAFPQRDIHIRSVSSPVPAEVYVETNGATHQPAK